MEFPVGSPTERHDSGIKRTAYRKHHLHEGMLSGYCRHQEIGGVDGRGVQTMVRKRGTGRFGGHILSIQNCSSCPSRLLAIQS